VRLAERPVTRWELAVCPLDDPKQLAAGAALGYPVDAGTGCFVDADAARRLVADEARIAETVVGELRRRGVGGGDATAWHTAWEAVEAELRRTQPSLLTRLDAAGLFRAGWAVVTLDPGSGANLVAFESGAGDGSYPSYWGLDEAGLPAALVTDFGLLDDADRGD
jgi:hypothetical protein